MESKNKIDENPSGGRKNLLEIHKSAEHIFGTLEYVHTTKTRA